MTDFVRDLSAEFPRLTRTNHRVVPGSATSNYNCVGWANFDTENWWQPGRYWPSQGPAGSGNQFELVQLFADQGFVQCDATDVADGCVLVALYSHPAGFWAHAARRRADGGWTSKIGEFEVIEHDTPDDVGGGDYGEVFAYMKRPLPPG